MAKSDHFPVDLLIHLTPNPAPGSTSQRLPSEHNLKVSPEILPDFHEALADGQPREFMSFCKSPHHHPRRGLRVQS